MSDDVRAIRNLIGRWMAASKAGDTAAVLNMMTDDVIFMTCGREPFGKEEFAAASASMKDMRLDGSAEVAEYDVPDPIGKSPQVHREVADLLEADCDLIARAVAGAMLAHRTAPAGTGGQREVCQ